MSTLLPLTLKSSFLEISTQLVVSVVGNAPKITDLASISEMQQMTSSVCSSTSTGYEKQLRDTRDGTYYYVGKMKDGKCWMLQNLALGSTSSSTSLSSTNSNISSSWSLPVSKTTAANGSTDKTVIQSWDFGKWVLATPLLTTGCGTTSIQSLSSCTKVGFVDVSSSSFSAGYTATTRSWDGANATSSTLVAVNCTSWSGSGTDKKCVAGTYDAHFLVGDYYSWNAATAGTGDSITSGEASGSICPKGWRLPTSNSTATGSFGGLTTAYSITSNATGVTTIASSPLRFVKSGIVVNTTNGYINYAGRDGAYWSSTPHSNSDFAYRLYFNSTSVDPSGNDNRYRRYGLPVRCVSQ